MEEASVNHFDSRDTIRTFAGEDHKLNRGFDKGEPFRVVGPKSCCDRVSIRS
jgi:hypothetical protein